MRSVSGAGNDKSNGYILTDFTSPSMEKVLGFVDRVAPTNLDVLLTGEPGVGKEVLARIIHARSGRCGLPFIRVEASRLETSPLDFEMFGFRRAREGSAWSELDRRDGATLYFDEITELDQSAQTHLLRLLLERERRSKSAPSDRSLEPRVLAATSADLWRAAEAGRFRQDLLLCLQGVQIRIPPLRERKEDIPRLAEHLLRALGSEPPGMATVLKPEHHRRLQDYAWPGNVRELREFLSRLAATGDDPEEALRALGRRPGRRDDTFDGTLSLAEMARRTSERVERRLILRALEEAGWNRKAASRRLSISYRSLLEKMRKLRLREVEGSGGCELGSEMEG